MTPEQIEEQREWLDRLTGYTPGPWQYRPLEYDDWGYVRGKKEDDGWEPFICQAKDSRASEDDEIFARKTGQDPWEANARFIAAAPALRDRYAAALDAIERLRATLSAITATDCYSREECTAMARAALKGEDQFGNGAQCKKCGGDMIQGIAMGQTFTPGTPDFPGDKKASTFSAGGPGKVVECKKCENCGWSVSE